MVTRRWVLVAAGRRGSFGFFSGLDDRGKPCASWYFPVLYATREVAEAARRVLRLHGFVVAEFPAPGAALGSISVEEAHGNA